MSGGDEQSSSAVGARAGRAKGSRRNYSWEWKRDVVQQTLMPGASVARVAQARGLNANQVFLWRRLHERGLLGSKKRGATRLLPVSVSDAATGALGQVQIDLAPGSATRNISQGTIHIELPKARLRIEGAADPSSLRAVLECLRG